MTPLPLPEPGRRAAEAFVRGHLGHLVSDEIAGSRRFRGGQREADAALASFEVAGYARRRNEVHPASRRGASQLSPYIRHGLLQLADVWRAVAGGPTRDVAKFRDELLWQEYARHWYARLGPRTAHGVRRELVGSADPGRGWDGDLACLDLVVGELETDGWLVNQTRMWLASHWAVREGLPWRAGENVFFRHLLDGSRAANRLGWQWTTGVGSSKAYGFSRWQVEKRAPGLCGSCALRDRCPIQDWPDDPEFVAGDRPPRLRGETAVSRLAGPSEVVRGREPDTVWLTAESLGDADPALAAHPDLPVTFVFDEPLLRTLGLSSKRLVFLTETLAELGTQRRLEIQLGDPVRLLSDRVLAVTHAPVPGFERRAGALGPVEVHPWPWLAQPSTGSVASFSAWRRKVSVEV